MTKLDDILTLCRKVEEVISNNDWPTEEGKMDEDGDCPLIQLVERVKKSCLS